VKPTRLSEFLAGTEDGPVGRLSLVWHRLPDGTTEYRGIAEGVADQNPQWCAGQLRLIAAQLERQGRWTPLELPSAAAARDRGVVLEIGGPTEPDTRPRRT
jgi:hypothetical protein